MALPKETTTGEVICNKCGWLHPEDTACKPKQQTTYGNLVSEQRNRRETFRMSDINRTVDEMIDSCKAQLPHEYLR